LKRKLLLILLIIGIVAISGVQVSAGGFPAHSGIVDTGREYGQRTAAAAQSAPMAIPMHAGIL
jgi:hypothetical protein